VRFGSCLRERCSRLEAENRRLREDWASAVTAKMEIMRELTGQRYLGRVDRVVRERLLRIGFGRAGLLCDVEL
jgi:hypothetical protein